MSAKWVFGAATAALLAGGASAAHAATSFISVLNGPNERPDPTNSPGVGTGTVNLSGDVDTYVLTYTLTYSGLTSAPAAGHIHESAIPPGMPPTEQSGPVVHP